MSEEYKLTRIRLINWHNFVDETIPVDGSLFLIGDNGSGKTTLLDAIHCALTGDWMVELNAAARLGGGKAMGRQLASVVLRYDVEKGYLREEGAIAYTALEFRRATGGGRASAFLTVGLGIYVASPDARPEKWGFITPQPLEKIQLILDTGEEKPGRPADRNELAAQLAAGQVLDVGRHRTRLGERFFRSRHNLEQVAAFLKAGKAYRELISKTNNFSELFAELLPSPDIETFHEVRRALSAIERMRIDLGALDEELERLRGLMDWQERIAQEREAVARYDYLEAKYAQSFADERFKDASRSLKKANDAEGATTALRQKSQARADVLGDELERLRSSRGADLLVRHRELSSQHRQAKDEEDRNTRRFDETHRDVEKRAAEHCATTAKLVAMVVPMAKTLDDLTAGMATQVPISALESLDRLADGFRILAREPETATFRGGDLEAERSRLRQALGEQLTTLRRKEQIELSLQETAREKVEEAEHQAIALRRQGEVDPPLAGIQDAVDRLRGEGIEATPLYRILEPKRKLSSTDAGLIERALGPRVLGTLVTSQDDHARARRFLLEFLPGIPLADPTPPEPSQENALDLTAVHATVFDLINVPKDQSVAHLFLEHHTERIAWVAEAVETLTGMDFITEQGHLHHRRFDAKIAAGPAIWLGKKAREKALRIKLDELEQEVRDGLETARQHRNAARSAQAQARRLEEMQRELDRLDLIGVAATTERRDEIARAIARLREELSVRQEELNRARLRSESLASTLATLQSEVEEQNLHKLSARMEELEVDLSREQQSLTSIVERHGRDKERILSANAESDAARQEAAECALPLAEARRVLLTLVPPEMRRDLDDYVYRVKHGKKIKPENFDANRSGHDRHIAGLTERIRHGEGIRNPHLWQKYAFSYDAESNVLADSTGKGLQTITTALQEQVDQLGQSLRGRCDELLERVVLEELVGTLRGELRHLDHTVREVNSLMSDLQFGRSCYRIENRIKPEYRRLHELLAQSSALGASAREELRDFFSSRLGELSDPSEGDLPPFLDYRRWYEFNLRVSTLSSEGVVLSKERLRQGSGGEQAVPSYLLLFCLTKLLWDGIGAKVRLLLVDEAFYGIDAGRRYELLRFCQRARIDLVVATPEMDGVTDALESSTTVLIEKTPSSDVYLWDGRYRNKVGTLFENAEPEEEELVLGVSPRSEDGDPGDS